MKLLRKKQKSVTPPLVTVLLSTADDESFVERALQSAVDQVTTFRFEVVVVDDVRDDGTRRVAEAFVKRHSSAARVAARRKHERSSDVFAREWATCGSDYVALLHGDANWTSNEKLQRLVDGLSARPECPLGFHDAFVELDEHGSKSLPEYRLFGARQQATVDPDVLWARCVVPGSAPLIARRFLPELPPWYVSLREVGWLRGNWPLFLYLTQFGPIAYLDEVMAVQRTHGYDRETTRRAGETYERTIEMLAQLRSVMPEAEPAIERELARNRQLLDREHRITARARAIAKGAPDARRVASLLAPYVPVDQSVIWLEPALRPPVANRHLVTFPKTVDAEAQSFAGEPSGTRAAPWIAPRFAYEFRLRRDSRVIAHTTVVADSAALARAERPGHDHPEGSPYVVADPNPARMHGTHGTTEIRWSAGDGSGGDVEVVAYSLADGMPSDDEAAVRALEDLRTQGGAFLLVPSSCDAFLSSYPGLEQHVLTNYRALARDERIGRLYDLRRERG